MDLENLERERIRLYKEHLKKQVQKIGKIKKQQNSYQRRKQLTNINELIQKMNEDDVRRLQQRKNTAMLLKEHNQGISSLRKTMLLGEEQANQIRNDSFVDVINKQDVTRIHKNKQNFAHLTHQNQVQNYVKRDIQGKFRNIDREEEEKHLKRLSQIQQQSQRNYEEIKRKHEQNMNLFNMHSQLMTENDQYRKIAEKFTECDVDIISRLKRNDEAERKRVLKNNQEILKNQMGEFNQRKSVQKSQILQGQNIDQSIFKNLLHGSPDYRRVLGEQLRSQISEMQTRKNDEIKTYKQKVRYGGIYGGVHGRQRQAQIRYIDRKLGLQPKVNRSVSFESEQKNKNHNSSKGQLEGAKQNNASFNELPINQSTKLQFQNLKREQVINLPILSSRESKYSSSKSSTSSSAISNNKVNPFSEKLSQEIQTGAEYTYINGQNNPQKKLFKSYDLVTGKHRFYG